MSIRETIENRTQSVGIASCIHAEKPFDRRMASSHNLWVTWGEYNTIYGSKHIHKRTATLAVERRNCFALFVVSTLRWRNLSTYSAAPDRNRRFTRREKSIKSPTHTEPSMVFITRMAYVNCSAGTSPLYARPEAYAAASLVERDKRQCG